MRKDAINWDDIPDIITKDQLYRICHISKSTALYLLKSGKIPCEYTGKRTRCYKIKKEDVIAYLQDRKVFPECYSAPASWYRGNYEIKMEEEIPAFRLEEMRRYYVELLARYPDVITAQNVVKLTGYGKTAINEWCRKKHLKSFQHGKENYIPKVYLIEFFCSPYFRMITRKSPWHIHILKDFSQWRLIHEQRDMTGTEVQNDGKLY